MFHHSANLLHEDADMLKMSHQDKTIPKQY